MSYAINAWVENGEPRLQILDVDSKTVRLAWRAGDTRYSPPLQNLFKELMLLSLVQQLRDPSRPACDPPARLNGISARTGKGSGR